MNMSIRSSFLLLLFLAFAAVVYAQPADTLVVRVGKESTVIFSIKDKQDLETLKHYNFQALMDDMLQKLEKRDTTPLPKPSSDYLKDSAQQAATTLKPEETWIRDQPKDDDWSDWSDNKRSERRRKQ